MTVYIIAEFKIHDRASYDKYDAAFEGVFAAHSGKILSVDEEPMVLEGEWTATRSVLIAFPDKAQAMAWMTSEPYREIAKDRIAGSVGKVRMVRGGLNHLA